MKVNFEVARFKKHPILVVLILLVHLGHGQKARLFTTDSEISNSLIDDIHQDHKGIVWIATEEGLNRYDGAKFVLYKEKEDSILNNYVRLIFEDSNNDLFFGFFNGLQIYNRAEDSFTSIPLILESGSAYPAHVLSIIERKNGTKLVGTSGHGVFQLRTEDGKLVARQKLNLVPSYYVNYIFEDSNQNLWISTQDKGLFRSGKEETLKNYFEPKTGVGSNITSVCQDSAGNVYVGSLSKGLFKYNVEKDLFEQIPYSGIDAPAIVTLHPTQDKKILIGTDGEGMMVYDPKQNLISKLNFNVSNFDFSKSKVHSIMEDKSGNYWLGLFQKGVVLLPSRSNNFNYIGYQSVSNNIIGSNYIMSIYRDRKGILWVGTDSDGLYGINLDGEQLAHFTQSEKEQYIPSTILCMYEDSNHDLWIGSYLDGISKLNRQTGKFEHFTKMVDNQSSPINRIYSITEDTNKNLWIGTLGYGLYSLNLTTGEIKNYKGQPNPYHPNDATNHIFNSWINYVLVSSDNQVYTGTADGISVFDIEAKTFTNLNDKIPSLWGQIIQTLHEDNLGRIWIGTTRGLLCYDPHKTSNNSYRFTSNDGLPSNAICAIESDEAQNLWVSTNYGISKFNPQDTTFINYYYNDGLQGNEFSKRASFKDQEGIIYFGGINGITYFKPEQINDNTRSLDVEITGFYIRDNTVKKGMKSGRYNIIDTSVMEADTFQLAHNDNSFSIEFSVMEYMNPKRITYLYSMKDEDWITLQQGTNTVTFDNLEPGSYQFKVRAKDYSTYSDSKTISVIIHPVWYFSIWAKAAYVFVSVLMIIAIIQQIRHRYKTRQRIREHKHAEQIKEAKLEFFTNISHEIRTPLSLILNPLKKLISNDPDINRQGAYSVMRRNTERILHLVNQMMDLRKIDKGRISLKFKETDIIQFIHETTEIFEELIQAKHIHFQIHHEQTLPKVWIDPSFFDKTIQNLLSNAIKFTPPNGNIQLSIETDYAQNGSHHSNQNLKIICADSGIGLNEYETEKIFDRFYQSPGGQTQSAGNGIGLHLTRSIVDLHHGTIHAENNQNGPGCRFIISIPLGRNHLNPEEIEDAPTTDQPNMKVQSVVPVTPVNDESQRVKSKSKRWVLVVDDDEEVRNYICNELAPEYHMIERANGKEGLSVALEKQPDLIISDVVMPEMDGITLCRKIKQNVNINHIPIILLTAKSGEKDNLEGLGIGADAYIPKPFNMEILKKTSENIIKNRELLKNNFSGSQLQSDKVKNIEIKSADEKLIQRIMNIINENISNPDLNVEFIASEIGISRVHLYRKLKELTNQSVRDLIRNIRLKQAAELMTTKNLNISEVAYATGFSNPSKFSSSFKNFYGVSPKSFIENKQTESVK